MKTMQNLTLSLILLISSQLKAQIIEISKSQRALVAVVNLSQGNEHSKMENNVIFKNEEQNARHLITKHLNDSYSQVIYLYRNQTTSENFLKAIEQFALNPEIKAIDVVYYLHGSTEKAKHGGPAIGFYTEEKIYPHAALMSSKLKEISAGKLRALYSDACWSSRQNKFWLEAGFLAVAGSKDVDTNMTLDLKRFVKKWSSGYSFVKSIDFANKSIFSKMTDRLFHGTSTKMPAGLVDLNISQMIQLNGLILDAAEYEIIIESPVGYHDDEKNQSDDDLLEN